jgi:CRP/FNR family transcriptional regulator, cyclic AMP receptor protein
MPTPYGIELDESCVGCGKRDERYFCALDANALRGLEQLRFATVYPRGALLFVEGQPARGVYLLCSGQVKLSTSSGDARVLITNLAGPGELLGLSAVLSDRPYEVTAETLEPSQVNFIRREDFLRFLSDNGDAALRAAAQLSNNYQAAFAQARLLGLSGTAAGKLARLLLDCAARNGRPQGRMTTMRLTLTHEEIGQLIGASRETVTRLFTDFKAQRLIEVRGSTLILLDSTALEAVAA